MKVYKNNLDYGIILLAYPLKSDLFFGIPFKYNAKEKRWVRANRDKTLSYYTQKSLDKLEYVGDTIKDYMFCEAWNIDNCYLIYKGDK